MVGELRKESRESRTYLRESQVAWSGVDRHDRLTANSSYVGTVLRQLYSGPFEPPRRA